MAKTVEGSGGLPKHHKNNFETILRAAANGDLALVQCRMKSTGEIVAAVAAVSWDGQHYTITPFALMIDGDPFELLDPPNPDGGFFEDK